MKNTYRLMITTLQILDYHVLSPKGESLGNILDLVINWHSGIISYVVLQTTVNLGYGKKLVAIPWHALNFEPLVNTYVLNITQSKFMLLPALNPEYWPDQLEHNHFLPLLSANLDLTI